jgi:hypothetical protein
LGAFKLLEGVIHFNRKSATEALSLAPVASEKRK